MPSVSAASTSSATARPSSVRRLVAHGGVRQFGKFAIVGGGNTAVDTAVYALLVLAGGGYVLAKLAAAIVATVNGYALNRRWTFRAGDFRAASLARYVLVQAIGFGTNLVVLVSLVEGAGMPPLEAQLLSLPAVAAVTFLANKHWTFRPMLREPGSAAG